MPYAETAHKDKFEMPKTERENQNVESCESGEMPRTESLIRNTEGQIRNAES